MVGDVRWVSMQKERHVIIEVEGHELETSEPYHRAEVLRVLRISHLESWWECGVNKQRAPYLAHQLSMF
jgi:hypothetical protein